jgi:trimeric autotransporter adhesin
MNPIRTNYYSGLALLTGDFVCEQDYHKSMLESLNQSVFLYGVAGGLDIEWDAKNNPTQVKVTAGMAIDGKGRQIVLTEARQVALDHLVSGKQSLLTISYHEELDEYNADTGVGGYKRIVQRPILRCVESFIDIAGIEILLAVIDVGSQGEVKAITYRYGDFERRYVGASLGSAQFIAEGTGVPDSGLVQPIAPPDPSMTIRARRALGTQAPYLEVKAPHTHLVGPVTMADKVGIGVDSPQAALQMQAKAVAGIGTFTSDNHLATVAYLSEAIDPFFAVGDVVLIESMAVLGRPPQRRTIIDIDETNRKITVDAPFTTLPFRNSPYTWVRSLAHFALDDGSSVLEVSADGQVGLGKTGTPAKKTGEGQHAVVITPNSTVGIALAGGTPPQAALHVNGDVMADHFIGDGSKLTGLSIASVWSQVKNTENIFYAKGNVGICDAAPAAPLSVGGGISTIGTGLVSLVEGGKLSGYLTNFTQEVRAGDMIAVGMLIEQTAVVKEVINDGQLIVDEQFPINLVGSTYTIRHDGTDKPGEGKITSNGTTIVGADTKFSSNVNPKDLLVIERFVVGAMTEDSATIDSIGTDEKLVLTKSFGADVKDLAYQYAPPAGTPKKGPGTLSSTGTDVTGDGTKFLQMAKGGTIYIERFEPSAGALQSWYVNSVESDTSLTLVKPSSSQAQNFGAKVSAFIVTSSLLAMVRANDEHSLLQFAADGTQQPLPPALLIAANGHVATAPNTVAINVEPEFLDSAYALQVKGAVSFGDATNISDASIDTLKVTKSVTIDGDGSAQNLLRVGTSLLTVTPTNVQIGSTTGTTAALDVGGELNCTSVVAKELSVPGVNVAQDGSVQCFGARKPVEQVWFTNNGTELSSPTAMTTDGFLIATVGTHGNYCPESFFGMLEAFTKENSTQSSPSMYATTSAFKGPAPLTEKADEKVVSQPFLAVVGSLTMPVRRGETWHLKLTYQSSLKPNVDVMWIPLGVDHTP